MKGFISFLLALLLCVGVGGGAYMLYKNQDKIELPSINSGNTSVEDSEGSVDKPPVEDSTGNGNTSEQEKPTTPETPEEPSEPELSVPTNEASLIESRMQMMGGAQVLVGEDEEKEPAIRFTCLVENSLVDEVNADENKTLAILLAPKDYFDTINLDNYTYIDWVKGFADAEKKVMLTTYESFGKYDDDTSYMRFTISNVLFNNMNRDFVALGVLIDNSTSTPAYKYSKLPDGQTYRSNARSVLYVSGAALNAYALGEASFTDAQVDKLKSYVGMVVDKKNGLTEPSGNNTLPVLTISNGTSVKIALSETHQMKWALAPDMELPMRFVSTNESVVAVNADGLITAKAYGTATVNVYVAGIKYAVAVTVSSNA